MSRRFVPPAVEAFLRGPAGDAARGLASEREEGFAEGQKLGRMEGHAAGLREGKSQARESHEAEMAQLRAEFARRHTIHTVAEALHRLLAAQDDTRRVVEQEARAMITQALRTLFPALLARVQGEEVAALIAEPLTERGNEGLTLRAHPDTLGALRAQGVMDLEPMRLTLMADTDLATGVIIANWASGGLRFDPAVLLEQVVDIISPGLIASEEELVNE